MNKKYLLEIWSKEKIEKEDIRKALKEQLNVEFIGLLDAE